MSNVRSPTTSIGHVVAGGRPCISSSLILWTSLDQEALTLQSGKSEDLDLGKLARKTSLLWSLSAVMVEEVSS